MNILPESAPKEAVIRAFEQLGYRLVRQGTHIALSYQTSSGVQFPLTMPDRSSYSSNTLRSILSRAGIARKDFVEAFSKAE